MEVPRDRLLTSGRPGTVVVIRAGILAPIGISEGNYEIEGEAQAVSTSSSKSAVF
jgi:hypothetical protein